MTLLTAFDIYNVIQNLFFGKDSVQHFHQALKRGRKDWDAGFAKIQILNHDRYMLHSSHKS